MASEPEASEKQKAFRSVAQGPCRGNVENEGFVPETLDEQAIEAVSREKQSGQPLLAGASQEDGDHAWLQRALVAERQAVAKELERRHRLLIMEVDRRFRERPSPVDVVQISAVSNAVCTPEGVSNSEPPSSLPQKMGSSSLPQKAVSDKHHDFLGHKKHSTAMPDEAGNAVADSTRWVPGRMLTLVVTSQTFEMLFGILILLNTLIMCLQVQYDGVDTDCVIKYSSEAPQSAEEVWPGFAEFFIATGWIFGIAFTLEVVLKMVALGKSFWWGWWNVFDFVIVASWLIDKGSAKYELFAVDPMLLRFCRLARLFRLVKAFRFIQMFDALQVLIASIKGSLAVLLWSTLLLFAIMMACALLLSHFLQEYMLDMENPEDVRHEVFKYFGSFSRSIVTMLELTLGNWVNVCRLLMENLTEWYAFAIVVYKIIVGFGVVKVITGCFLHETFKIASTDDEIMIMRKQREQESHRGKMERLFAKADDQGHGTLTREEFAIVLSEDHVKTWLSAMEISFEDANMLFELIAANTRNEDHFEEPRISANEFLQGTTRLRGYAKSLDMWQLLTLSEKMTVDIRGLTEMVCDGGLERQPHHASHQQPSADMIAI